ncbi:hypothetical protein [Orrella sp. 11846]|uniref:hypothetical protein n=1 Tax=Orrella sp. 11846 TaxID=3409913 RepID=UPI003B5B5905
MTSMSYHTAKLHDSERSQFKKRRSRLIGDVLLVSFWAIATPGLMWMGFYLGY